MQLIDFILIISILILCILYLCNKQTKEFLHNVKPSKNVSFNDTVSTLKYDKDQQCRRYFDERLSKPLVPEFENITVSQNPTLQEVYDRHVVDYRKLIPNKNKLDNDNQVVSVGAYGNSNYTIDQIQYVNENPLNGGQIDRDLFGFDPDFREDYSIF
jgi:hypothetical protein